MKEIEKITKKIKSLDLENRDDLILKLLSDNIIDYTEISILYIRYLKNKQKEKAVNIQGLAMALSWFIHKPKKKIERFIYAKGIYHLLKSRVFLGAKIEDDWVKGIKQFEYSEDENGHHKFKDLKEK